MALRVEIAASDKSQVKLSVNSNDFPKGHQWRGILIPLNNTKVLLAFARRTVSSFGGGRGIRTLNISD